MPYTFGSVKLDRNSERGPRGNREGGGGVKTGADTYLRNRPNKKGGGWLRNCTGEKRGWKGRGVRGKRGAVTEFFRGRIPEKRGTLRTDFAQKKRDKKPLRMEEIYFSAKTDSNG